MPVFINNVDDYLGPSQACVNPLFAPPPKPTQPADAKVVNNIISNTTNGQADATAENADIISKSTVQNRRRIRQRRAPRMIKCEESSNDSATPHTATGEPIRLVNDKVKNDIEIDITPTTNNAPTTTTTQTIKKKAKATVTLSDCLSCSGCVTSAEAVLMSHHSIDKLREVTTNSQQNQQQKRIVFTISSASLADLYRHLYLEVRESSSVSTDGDGNYNEDSIMTEATDEKHLPSRHEFLARIAAFLHSEFGAEVVIDGDVSQRISLMESASEFCYRYRKCQQSRGDHTKYEQSAATLPSVALSSTKTRYINKNSNGGDAAMDEDTLMEITTLNHPPGLQLEEEGRSKVPSSPQQITTLPMLASSCPGFVCLVEKTAPAVVPLLSSAKSPMAVAGTLLKTGPCSQSAPRNDSSLDEDSVIDGNDRASCYHIAIMPCHDKKLEAGRGDFAWEKQALLQYGNGDTRAPKKSLSSEGATNGKEEEEDLVNEVDLVLTTGELLEILSDAASTFTVQVLNDAPESDVSTTFAVRDLLDDIDINHGSAVLMTAKNDNLSNKGRAEQHDSNLELYTGVHGSGSYADFIFRYAAFDLFGCKLPRDKPLPWASSTSTYAAAAPTAGKTAGVIRRRRRRQETTDMREVTLYEHCDGTYSCCDNTNDGSGHSSSKPVLRFATAYGFKNVQLILQNLSNTTESSKSSGYDYVEIMACPSGCSNGGGQVGANGQRETPRETKERVRKTVSAVPIIRPSDECCGSLAKTLCDCDSQKLVNGSILHSECFDESARALFHTRFHVVPKLELSTGATAGVAVSDTVW